MNKQKFYPISFPALTIVATFCLAFLMACGAVVRDDVSKGRQALTLQDLDSQLANGPARVQIKLADGLNVKELSVNAEFGHNESVQATVLAIDPNGTVSLDIAQLSIAFDDSTRFRTLTDSKVSRADWVAAVQTLLDGGQMVSVRASRPEPTSLQAPTDATFLATDLRMDEHTDRRRLELLIGSANLVTDSVNSGTLTALDRVFVLDASTFVHASDDHGGDDNGQGGDDHGQGGDDHGQGGDDHGQGGDDHGQGGDDHGQGGDDHGQGGDDHGQGGDDHGQGGDDHGQGGDDHGEGGDDHGEGGDDHGQDDD